MRVSPAYQVSLLPTVVARPGERIVGCGDVSENVFFLRTGWAFRYMHLANGARQILDFLLPGDIFSAASVVDERFTFSVEALTEVQVGEVRRQSLAKQLTLSPALQSEWLRDLARQSRSADELIAVVGRGSAEVRVAHLLFQLARRISRSDLASEHGLPFPLKLVHMADAVGLTPECVCRMIGRFRRRGIVSLSNGCLEVLSFEELEQLGSLRAAR
jgi:CRP-like cAMP-binding protein